MRNDSLLSLLSLRSSTSCQFRLACELEDWFRSLEKRASITTDVGVQIIDLRDVTFPRPSWLTEKKTIPMGIFPFESLRTAVAEGGEV